MSVGRSDVGMGEWTHTYRKPYEHTNLRLRILEEAPPHDGTTFWFMSHHGKQRAFKLDDPDLKEMTKKMPKTRKAKA